MGYLMDIKFQNHKLSFPQGHGRDYSLVSLRVSSTVILVKLIPLISLWESSHNFKLFLKV